jgi:hypothetical protein
MQVLPAFPTVPSPIFRVACLGCANKHSSTASSLTVLPFFLSLPLSDTVLLSIDTDLLRMSGNNTSEGVAQTLQNAHESVHSGE